jgi:hypothetical protein
MENLMNIKIRIPMVMAVSGRAMEVRNTDPNTNKS